MEFGNAAEGFLVGLYGRRHSPVTAPLSHNWPVKSLLKRDEPLAGLGNIGGIGITVLLDIALKRLPGRLDVPFHLIGGGQIESSRSMVRLLREDSAKLLDRFIQHLFTKIDETHIVVEFRKYRPQKNSLLEVLDGLIRLARVTEQQRETSIGLRP